jgi:hypothetical protein
LNVAFCTASTQSDTSSSTGSDQEIFTGECYSIAHLPCLAKHFLANPGSEASVAGGLVNPVLPHTGRCPGCRTRSDWGEIIRGIYARKDGEKEDGESAEKTRIRDMKAAELADKKRKGEEEKEAKRRIVEEEREAKRRKLQEERNEKRRLKELEKAEKAKGKRRAKSKVTDSSGSD